MAEPETELGAIDVCSLTGDQWIKCNFDTGAARTALPEDEDKPQGKETGKFYRTASGEVIPDMGVSTLCGTDEEGKYLRLSGNVTRVHKVLVSAAAVHRKKNFTVLEAGGGYIIPEGSALGKEMRDSYRNLLEKHGTKELVPLWEENGVYNFYLRKDRDLGAIGGREDERPESPSFPRLAPRRR